LTSSKPTKILTVEPIILLYHCD